MNNYFYKLWVPFNLLSILVLGHYFLNDQLVINWIGALSVWFFIGPVGIGVGFHRLFSHRQFATYTSIERGLAILGSLAGYSPLGFWCNSHIFHHKNSDTKEDISSPKVYGFIESFLLWRLRNRALEKLDTMNYCSRLLYKDKFLKWTIQHFFKIFWMFGLITAFFGGSALLSLFIIPVQLEHLRLNLISSFSHIKLPLSYRNHADTPDSSYNNAIFAYLTLGFAWHNNHHHDERNPILHEKWWELDIEGVICKIISKRD